MWGYTPVGLTGVLVLCSVVDERKLMTCVDIVDDLGRHRSAGHVRLAVNDRRRLTDRQLPENERSETEGVEVAENRRVAG